MFWFNIIYITCQGSYTYKQSWAANSADPDLTDMDLHYLPNP